MAPDPIFQLRKLGSEQLGIPSEVRHTQPRQCWLCQPLPQPHETHTAVDFP